MQRPAHHATSNPAAPMGARGVRAAALAVLFAASPLAGAGGGAYQDDPFVRPGLITPLTLPDAWPTHFDRNPEDHSPAGTRTRVVMLGTGMPLPNPYRAGPAFALIVDDMPYLIDAGEGIWRSIARAALVNGDAMTRALAPDKLRYLFLTHLHEDHTVGIPSLLLNPYKLDIPTPKEIYGPAGTADMVRHIVQAWKIDIAEAIHDGYRPEGGRATGHDFRFAAHGIVFRDARVTVEAFRTRHGSLRDSFAYRLTTPDRVVVFAGDGGPYNTNIVAAARGADVLVAETVTEDNIGHAPWGGDTVEAKKQEIFRFHFSPAVLARIANEAGVGAIVLTHEQNYSAPADYDRLSLLREVQAAGWKGPIYSSLDADVY